MDSEQTLQIPSFTLYPLSTEDLKTCYESHGCKVLCALAGPYCDRRATTLLPSFNIRISQAQLGSGGALTAEQLVRLERKLQEVLAAMVVHGKYQRMAFDVTLEVVQLNPHNPPSFLLAPLLTLLSYTALLKCLEVTSAFTCSAAALRNDQQLLWDYSPERPHQESDHMLVLCTDQRDRRSILTHFEGEYSFATYERLAGALQEANDELARFQLEKVDEVYQMFHQ